MRRRGLGEIFRAIGVWWDDLMAGDPVAIGLLVAILAVILGIIVLWIFVIRKKDKSDAREREKRKKANKEKDKRYKDIKGPTP